MLITYNKTFQVTFLLSEEELQKARAHERDRQHLAEKQTLQDKVVCCARAVVTTVLFKHVLCVMFRLINWSARHVGCAWNCLMHAARLARLRLARSDRLQRLLRRCASIIRYNYCVLSLACSIWELPRSGFVFISWSMGSSLLRSIEPLRTQSSLSVLRQTHCSVSCTPRKLELQQFMFWKQITNVFGQSWTHTRASTQLWILLC